MGREIKFEKSFFVLLVLLLFVFIFFLNLSAFSFVSADVISINGGGDENLVLTPDRFIEGFFFGDVCEPTTCAALGYNCGTWDNGCGGTLVCGSLGGACASGFTCTSGVCVAVPVDGGGGTGGGGETTPSIVVEPKEFNINMLVNTNVERTVKITNTGTSNIEIKVYAGGDFSNRVILESDTLSLNAGQTKEFKLTFVAPSSPRVYTGIIYFNGVQIPVALNVKTELLLFDSNIVVLNDNYQVPQGSDLKTQVTLIPMGDKQRLDVTLNYAIRDFSGNVYLTKSETLLIEEQLKLNRNFDTGALPLGRYVVSLDLIYPNGVAPSSAQFEVIEPLPKDIIGAIVWILIILILLILIIILIIMIKRYIKKRMEENSE